jgi:hypothetical protein
MPAPPGSLPMKIGSSVERGLISILSVKCTGLLSSVSSGPLILLVSSAAVVVHRSLHGAQYVTRVSNMMTEVFTGISINTLMSIVTIPEDTGLTFVNLFCVYTLCYLFRDDYTLGVAQYLIASNLRSAINGFGRFEVLAVAWTISVLPSMARIDEDLSTLAQFIGVQWCVSWFSSSQSSTLALPVTLSLIYLLSPLARIFPVLSSVNGYAVFAVTSDPKLAPIPSFALITCLWIAWRTALDEVTTGFALRAGAGLLVSTTIDSLQPLIDQDPIPVILAILLFIRIIEIKSE